jgi:hypothetical protein
MTRRASTPLGDELPPAAEPPAERVPVRNYMIWAALLAGL